MKAVVVQSIGQVVVKEVPEPVVGDYDVLCEVLAAAVCAGTDNHIVHGDEYQNPQYPLILGHEAIGRVIVCGAKVKNLRIGDLVTRITNRLPADSGYNLQWGAFAERGIAADWQARRDDGVDESDWSRYTVHRVLPKDFDPVEATMIITWRETHAFFKQMNIKSRGRLLIIGSGAQALAFTEHARNHQIEITVVGSPARKDLFLNVGAGWFVSYRDDYPTWLRSSGQTTFDAIIDAIGKSDYVNRALPLLAPPGKVGVYGLDEFPNYALDTSQAQGAVEYFVGDRYDEGASHNDIMEYLQQGKLNVWNYLSPEHIYPLAKINDALAACRDRRALKSLISFRL